MLETLITGFIGGVCAWFVTDYIAKPMQRFFDLRREVNRCLVVYANVGARSIIGPDGLRTTLDLSPEEDARLVQAQKAFRDLGGNMRAFANVDFLASRIVKLWGYDANRIANALIDYSNEIVTYGAGRAGYHDRVERLLRVRSEAA
jgi:hypothetical protein